LLLLLLLLLSSLSSSSSSSSSSWSIAKQHEYFFQNRKNFYRNSHNSLRDNEALTNSVSSCPRMIKIGREGCEGLESYASIGRL
jgi:hypothetical protein